MITTLLLLTLLAGFAIAAQNRALSQARVLEKVREVEEERVTLQSVRALALPLVGEAILDGKTEARVLVDYEGRAFGVEIEEMGRRGWYRFTITP